NWTAHDKGCLWIGYFRDGRLVTCGRDNNIALWDANGGQSRKLKFDDELPLRVAFAQDGKRVFATDFLGHVAAWSAADGKRLGELNANPEGRRQRVGHSASLSPSGGATVAG